MTVAAILGTGPSMSHAIATALRGRCCVIAISDAFRLAPWADALVSTDAAWWKAHPEALKFAGRKFCSARFPGTEQIYLKPHYAPGSNSGFQGMRVAEGVFKATKILLLGFDMHGTHYFGAHRAPLRNTTPPRFRAHIQQCAKWRGCAVVNCTPGSHLKAFPFSTIEEELLSVAA